MLGGEMRRKFKIGDVICNEENEVREVIAFSQVWDSYILANPNGVCRADVVSREGTEEYFRLKKNDKELPELKP